MRRLKAEKPFYAILSVSGDVIEAGKGDVTPQEGETVEWFDTIAERETDSRVGQWRAQLVRTRRVAVEVEAAKSSQEYAEKSQEAIRWLANNPEQEDIESLAHTHGDYSEETYMWLSLEVEIAGKTPRQAATEIVAAIKRDQTTDMGAWAKARQRIITREALRNDG